MANTIRSAVDPAKKCWHEEGKGASPCCYIALRLACSCCTSIADLCWLTIPKPASSTCAYTCVAMHRANTDSETVRHAGYEIMERILKPLVGVFDDVMQELHDSRVPDVGREEEDAFMSKAVQYIRQYILSDRVTMR